MHLKNLFIYGAGGFAREVTLLVHEINKQTPTWNFQGYVTDDPAEHGQEIHGKPILGAPHDLLKPDSQAQVDVVIAMGTPKLLLVKSRQLREVNPEIRFPTLVHPNVVLNKRFVKTGEGNVIAAGCNLTSDIKIGNFNIINLGCMIAHDVAIGNYCAINPGAILNGGAKIESLVTIGSGAVLMPGVTIGEGAVVALGAVAGADVEPYTVVAGNPARIVRRLEKGD